MKPTPFLFGKAEEKLLRKAGVKLNLRPDGPGRLCEEGVSSFHWDTGPSLSLHNWSALGMEHIQHPSCRV